MNLSTISGLKSFCNSHERKHFRLRDSVFQILSMEKVNNETNLFQVTLSDNKEYYDYFFITIDDNNIDICKCYNKVKIKSISTYIDDRILKFFIYNIELIEIISKKKVSPFKKSECTQISHVLKLSNRQNHSTTSQKSFETFHESSKYKFFIFQSSSKKKSDIKEINKVGNQENSLSEVNKKLVFDDSYICNDIISTDKKSNSQEDKQNEIYTEKIQKNFSKLEDIQKGLEKHTKSADLKRNIPELDLSFTFQTINEMCNEFKLKVRILDERIKDKNSFRLIVIDKEGEIGILCIDQAILKNIKNSIVIQDVYLIEGLYHKPKYNYKNFLIVKTKFNLKKVCDDFDIPFGTNKLAKLDDLEDIYTNGVAIIDIFLNVISVNNTNSIDDFKYQLLKVTDQSNLKIFLWINRTQSEKKIKPGDTIFATNVYVFFNEDSGYELNMPHGYLHINLDTRKFRDMKNQTYTNLISHYEVFNHHKRLIKTFPINKLLRIKETMIENHYNRYESKFIRGRIKNIYHKKENVYRKCSICKKKMKLVNNTFICDNSHTEINPAFAYCLRLEFADLTGVIDLVLFDEVANKLLLIDALKYYNMIEDYDENYKNINEILNKILFVEYYFLVSMKNKSYKTDGNYIESFDINLLHFEKFDISTNFTNMLDKLKRYAHHN
jgi:hypothetical protein